MYDRFQVDRIFGRIKTRGVMLLPNMSVPAEAIDSACIMVCPVWLVRSVFGLRLSPDNRIILAAEDIIRTCFLHNDAIFVAASDLLELM